jgi:hypothetical protein
MSPNTESSGPLFSQPNWTVSGDVYNVAGDLILTKDSSKQDFVKAIEDLRDEVARLEDVDESRRIEAVSYLDSSVQEARRENPSKPTVVDRLKQAAGVLEAGSGTAENAWKLAKTLGSIAVWAATFFA